jgi:hypothetical protein
MTATTTTTTRMATSERTMRSRQRCSVSLLSIRLRSGNAVAAAPCARHRQSLSEAATRDTHHCAVYKNNTCAEQCRAAQRVSGRRRHASGQRRPSNDSTQAFRARTHRRRWLRVTVHGTCRHEGCVDTRAALRRRRRRRNGRRCWRGRRHHAVDDGRRLVLRTSTRTPTQSRLQASHARTSTARRTPTLGGGAGAVAGDPLGLGFSCRPHTSTRRR